MKFLTEQDLFYCDFVFVNTLKQLFLKHVTVYGTYIGCIMIDQMVVKANINIL